MKEKHYQFQLVGSEASIKRMSTSVYLTNEKQQEQTIKVCICDDLPHVVKSCDERQKAVPCSEMLQKGLTVSIGYERSLSVCASVVNNQEYICKVTPREDFVIPPNIIWSSGAIVEVEFKVEMVKANETASIQISIMSQDEEGNEIPLSVPPRAHLIWQPKNVAGVSKLREAWESSSDGSISPQRRSWATRQGPQPYLQQYLNPSHKSVSLPHYQQPAHYGIKEKVGRLHEEVNQSSAIGLQRWHNTTVSSQDPNWNVVTDPKTRIEETYDHNEKNLPDWAKGFGDDFDYDDVMVV